MADFLGTIEKASLKSFREFKTSPTISAGTLTLDLSSSSTFEVTHNANITTLTISSPVTSNSNAVQAFTLRLVYTATAYTVTWGAGIKWPLATAPTLSAGNGVVDIFTFVSYDGGSSWNGFVGGQNY